MSRPERRVLAVVVIPSGSDLYTGKLTVHYADGTQYEIGCMSFDWCEQRAKELRKVWKLGEFSEKKTETASPSS